MERPAISEIEQGLSTKSAKIRALAAAGYERAEIARHLGISYQHVNNVIINSGRSQARTQKRMATPPLLIEHLASRGFTLKSEWLLEREQIVLSKPLPPERGVYAFVVDGTVRYIGVAGDLRRRLSGYARPGGDQKTNIRMRPLILAALQAESKVEIWTAAPPDLVWNELPVDQIVGLEAGLIHRFKPPWNLQGTTMSDVTLEDL